MKLFKLDKSYSIICEAENTRYGFRHLAYLMHGQTEIEKTKACYYNRTWEAYPFQTVAKGVIDKHFTDTKTKNKYLKLLGEKYGR